MSKRVASRTGGLVRRGRNLVKRPSAAARAKVKSTAGGAGARRLTRSLRQSQESSVADDDAFGSLSDLSDGEASLVSTEGYDALESAAALGRQAIEAKAGLLTPRSTRSRGSARAPPAPGATGRRSTSTAMRSTSRRGVSTASVPSAPAKRKRTAPGSGLVARSRTLTSSRRPSGGSVPPNKARKRVISADSRPMSHVEAEHAREAAVLLRIRLASKLYAALPPFDALTGLKLLQRQKTFNLEVKLEGVDRDGYLYLFREAGRVRSTTKPLSGYATFVKSQFAEGIDAEKPASERMAAFAAAWNELSDTEQAKYTQQGVREQKSGDDEAASAVAATAGGAGDDDADAVPTFTEKRVLKRSELKDVLKDAAVGRVSSGFLSSAGLQHVKTTVAGTSTVLYDSEAKTLTLRSRACFLVVHRKHA